MNSDAKLSEDRERGPYNSALLGVLVAIIINGSLGALSLKAFAGEDVTWISEESFGAWLGALAIAAAVTGFLGISIRRSGRTRLGLGIVIGAAASIPLAVLFFYAFLALNQA